MHNDVVLQMTAVHDAEEAVVGVVAVHDAEEVVVDVVAVHDAEEEVVSVGVAVGAVAFDSHTDQAIAPHSFCVLINF